MPRALAAAAFLLALASLPAGALGTEARAASRAQSASKAKSKAAMVTATPVLLEFLKELKGEAELGVRQAAAVARWCRGARQHRASMASVLQRQLDEAAIAVRQISLEERRLSSEARLSNATCTEKQRQLEDSVSTADLALAEFKREQEQMERTIAAAARAISLIESRQAQDSDAESPGGAGSSADSAIDGELAGLLPPMDGAGDSDSSALQVPSAAVGPARAQKLLQALRKLHSQLVRERDTVAGEHNAMLQKLWSFTDHLNSSIVEAQAQVAAINMQAAQRKREGARMDGRITGLTSLLKAVNASEAASEAACSEEEARRRRIASQITAESGEVASLLRDLSPGSTDALFGARSEDQAPAFLQISSRASRAAVQRALLDLSSLAKRFPGESEWYREGAKSLGAAHAAPKGVAMLQRHRTPPGKKGKALGKAPAKAERKHKEVAATEAEADAGSRDPLKSIRQFVVDTSGPESGGAAGASFPSSAVAGTAPSDEMKGVFTGILARVHARARAVASERGRCESILRDSAADGAAMGRSLKRVAAKLHIAQAMMSEYKRALEYDEAQQKLVSQQLQQLNAVSLQEARATAATVDSLRNSAQRLVSAAASLQGSDEESRRIQELLRHVEGHRASVQQGSSQFHQRAAAAEAADRALLLLLSSDAEHQRRHLARAKAEADLLAARVRAKGDDQALSAQFQDLANRLCSKARMQQLNAKVQELQHEEDTLQNEAQGAAAVAAA